MQWVVLLGGALGRMFGGTPHVLFVFYRPDIDVKMFVVSVLNLQNKHCEVSLIHKCSCFFSVKKIQPIRKI